MADSSSSRPQTRVAKRLEMTPRSTPVWAKKPRTTPSLLERRSSRRLLATPRGLSLSRTPVTRCLEATDETARRARLPQTRGKQQVKHSEVLTGRKWNVYSVSLLYNLQAMIDSLGSYSRSLTAHVKVGIEGGAAAYSLDGNEGEDVENEGKLTVTKATITIMKDLKSYVTDHPAIRITMNGRKAAGKNAILFDGVLCGCGTGSEGKFVSLPLLLWNGLLSVARHLLDWLQATFDCRISRLDIPSYHLAYLVANWTRFTSDKLRNLKLCFSPSRHVIDQGLNQITMTVEHKDAKALLASIHSDMDTELTEEEAERFMLALSGHIRDILKIRVDMMTLNCVTTCVAKVSSNGVLTVFSQEHVLQMLEFLTNVAGC
ncbi:centromere protein L-like isoform X2 [Corticium candelabrum]|uniref:centromere protein L-like isoform X2 n=1 Tax=Corticium candelabrum TaxID=121492 RepID=UPI002E260FDF|nr:centromere protein L-like isoform X2 [Corticium candelabrum]